MSAVQSFSAAYLRLQPRNCRTDQSQDLSPCLTPLTLATATAHAGKVKEIVNKSKIKNKYYKKFTNIKIYII